MRRVRQQTPQWAGLLVYFVVSMVFSVVVVITRPAAAQDIDISRCEAGGDPHAIVTACSAIIQAAHRTPRDKAIAYAFRGLAYVSIYDPDTVSLNADEKTIMARMGILAHAMDDGDHAIKADPKFAGGFVARGVAAYLCARYPSKVKSALLNHAVDDLTTALALHPGDEAMVKVAYIYRGHARRQLNQLATAIADYTAAIKLSPHNAQALYWRGQAEKQIGETAAGDDDLAAAARVDPSYGKQ